MSVWESVRLQGLAASGSESRDLGERKNVLGRHGPPRDLTEPAAIERFIDGLAQGAAVGKAIASMRPGSPALGRALLAYAESLGQTLNSCASITARDGGVRNDNYHPSWDEPLDPLLELWADGSGMRDDLHRERLNAGEHR